MTKNDLMSLVESNSPLDYPILTPQVSFVSFCASFEASLIHSFGTLTIIDHVSIIKYSVMKPHTKNGGITSQSYPKHARTHENLTQSDPYIGIIGLTTRRYKKNHIRHASHYHLMRVTCLLFSKASPLIPSLSVLSIKFHNIQLKRHGSWLLVCVNHR